jgi:hypothetical protein
VASFPIVPEFAMRESGNRMKTSVRLADLRDETWTGDLPNTKPSGSTQTTRPQRSMRASPVRNLGGLHFMNLFLKNHILIIWIPILNYNFPESLSFLSFTVLITWSGPHTHALKPLPLKEKQAGGSRPIRLNCAVSTHWAYRNGSFLKQLQQHIRCLSSFLMFI